MWDRKVLKQRGKTAFKANYWLAVLVAFIFMIVAGGGTGAAAGSSGYKLSQNTNQTSVNTEGSLNDLLSSLQEIPASIDGSRVSSTAPQTSSGAAAMIIAVILAVVAIVGAVTFVIKLLVLNPAQVSCQSFFIRNSEGKGELNNLERGFSPNWGGNVKTMFLRDLFLFLWSLLFIIPGIIKAYSYRMVPYILADHPEMSGTAVITLSRQMMNGNKWRAFVLDLSFIGWEILSLLTLGILGIFYVNPYKHSTNAELYQALKKYSAD